MYAIDVRQIQTPIKEEYRRHPERRLLEAAAHFTFEHTPA